MSRATFEALATNPAQLDAMTRDQLIELCQWNDSNGVWTDEQSAAEGWPPATVEQLRAVVRNWLANN